MPDSTDLNALSGDRLRVVESEVAAATARRDRRYRTTARPAPYVQLRTASLAETAAARHATTAGSQPRSVDMKNSAHDMALPPGGRTRRACQVISASAFAAWLILMLTVAAAGGSTLQIVGITMIPFAAHVISICLTAYAGPRDSGGARAQ